MSGVFHQKMLGLMTLVDSVKVLCIFLATFLFSCSSSVNVENNSYLNIKGNAQGTTFSIIYQDSLKRDFSTKIDSILNEIDNQLSNYDTSSFISKFNNSIKLTQRSSNNDLFVNCFNKSKSFYELTNGYFNAAVFPLVEYWGFFNNSDVEVDTNVIVDSILPLINMDSIYIRKNKDGSLDIIKSLPSIKLDFNAIAQGYSVDLIGNFLQSRSIKNFMVEIGGEITARGVNSKGESWKIGIETPVDSSSIGQFGFQKIIQLKNKSIATSGNYRKFKKINGIRLSHTINPKTGFSAMNNLLSVSVITDSAANADALATSFMAMGLKKSKEFITNKGLDVKAYFIYDSAGKYQEWSNF